jgi:hypothetical protein
MTDTIRTLDELLTALCAIAFDDNKDPIPSTVHPALPQRGSLVIWEEMPLFGGEEPSNTIGVWSWDATRLLVGEGYDWRIVARDESND